MIITIPANQHPNKGEKFKVLFGNQPIYLESTTDSSTASYDTVVSELDFNPGVHGFVGLNTALCNLLFVLHIDNEHVKAWLRSKFHEMMMKKTEETK